MFIANQRLDVAPTELISYLSGLFYKHLAPKEPVRTEFTPSIYSYFAKEPELGIKSRFSGIVATGETYEQTKFFHPIDDIGYFVDGGVCRIGSDDELCVV